ncbi:hypothetical protein [Spirosoma areae]
MQTINRQIRSGLILFWALYFSIVLLSNSADALKALGLLPSNWPFASGNFGLIQQVIGVYGLPVFVAGLLFAGVIVWQGFGMMVFWKAFIGTIRQTPNEKVLVHQALGITIGLWAAFILADEFFLAYTLGGLSATHFSLLLAELATFILIRLLE